MLNPQTHGKGLGIHGDLLFLQHRKGIPGAVTDSQNHSLSGKKLLLLLQLIVLILFGILIRLSFLLPDLHSADLSAFRHKICYLTAKAHLTSQSDNLLTHGLHNPGKNIGTNVRLAVVKN